MQEPLASQRVCCSPACHDVCTGRDQQQRHRGTRAREQLQEDGEQEQDLEAAVADSAVCFEVRYGQFFTTSSEAARQYPPVDVMRRHLVDVTTTCR